MKITLKMLKPIINVMIATHRAAGWNVRIGARIELSKTDSNGRYIEHSFTRREYADKFCI